MVAIWKTGLSMTLCLQMVLSLQLNVAIREAGTDEIGNSTAEGDVIDVLVSTPGFKSLVKLVTEFGLVDTLKKAKEVTIFAPTDDALDGLVGPGQLFDNLAKEEPETAKQILLTHVVGAKLPAAAIKEGKEEVTTLSGFKITLEKSGQSIKILYTNSVPTNSNVVKADIFASNGVIHAIDSLIWPYLLRNKE